ncbi:MAG: TetR/AcrR family transcriptional regulator [Myxococcota bacterium]
MGASMGDAASTGRDALVRAARSLFAERGTLGVSMREVGRAADQRNTNAVQYHFGDREGLLLAVLEPYHRLVAARRGALLDALEADAAPAMRDLAGALVRPSAAMLEEEGGRDYLRIQAELIADPRSLRRRAPFGGTQLDRWHRLAGRHMASATLPLHRRFSAIQLCFSELGRRAASRRRADHRLFVSDLVDLTAGVLGAEVSEETLRLLEEKSASRPSS